MQTRPMQNEIYHAQVALDILEMDLADPKNGKCDRMRVDDAVWLGVYSGSLKPMNPTDVMEICDLLDAFIGGMKEGLS